ncbi:hypothetical protein JNUCC83_00805 [Vagococcus sp. JNUCC 83]
MENQEMVKQALETNSDLKLIMKGEVLTKGDKKVGVTSVVFVSEDVLKVEKMYNELVQSDTESFYMVYAVNLNEKLNDNSHYPSIAMFSEDLV